MSAPGRVEPTDSAGERCAPAIPSAEADHGAEPLRRRRRVDLAPYLLVLPATLFLLIFFAWPMLQSLLLAVQDASGGLTLEHIQRMTGDLNFGDAVRNTLILLVLIVPLQVVLALIMALII